MAESFPNATRSPSPPPFKTSSKTANCETKWPGPPANAPVNTPWIITVGAFSPHLMNSLPSNDLHHHHCYSQPLRRPPTHLRKIDNPGPSALRGPHLRRCLHRCHGRNAPQPLPTLQTHPKPNRPRFHPFPRPPHAHR